MVDHKVLMALADRTYEALARLGSVTVCLQTEVAR